METNYKPKRESDNFEHDPNYYIESWINGNKSHVISELIELNKVSVVCFNNILIDLPREIQEKVIGNIKLYIK